MLALSVGLVSHAQAGSILREVYQGISGNAISDLTNASIYPNSPTLTNFVTDFFEAPVDFDENYGQRMRGYITPPVTGNYTFWIATDDNGALYLSTDDSPANVRLIANVPEWSASREWTKFPQQQSSSIRLEAGKAYYVEALQKEGGGGDNLAVRWLRPDGVDEGPIPATYLLPFGTSFTPPIISEQPANATVVEGGDATFEVKIKNIDLVYYQWSRNGTPISGANGRIYTFGPVSLDDSGATFSAILTNKLGSTNTSIGTLTVVPDVTRPALVNVLNLGANTLQLTFSEPVSPATATTPGNYTVSGGVNVTSAVMGADANTVLLTTSTLTLGATYTVHVSNVQDRARTPNTILPDSQAEILALEFVSQDIGGNGSIQRIGPGAYNVTSGGANVGEGFDQFQFAWEQRSGNFDLQVRVAAATITDAFMQAGLMARANLSSNTTFAAVFGSSAQLGCYFESRLTTGGKATLAAPSAGFPVNYPQTWLRLRRSGNTFTGFASLDGQTWVQLGTATISMPAQIYTGLALASGNSQAVTSAQFRDYGATTSQATGSFANDREPIGPSSRRTGLIFSEIMYHPKPPPGNTNNLEFVEIYNADSIFEDIGGWQLKGGISYTFPSGFRLAAGDFAVVAADPAALKQVYGITNVFGPWNGVLNNAGDSLKLVDNSGAIKLDLTYSPKAPWPVAADGAGHALSLIRPSYGEADPRAWGASEQIGGSPGGLDTISTNPQKGVVINEFLAHTDDPQLDFVELYNGNNNPVDLSGCYLTDDLGTNKFKFPQGTSIPARGFISLDQNQLGFSLNAAGESILFLNPTASRVIDAISFGGQENGVSTGRSPDGASTIRRLSQPTPGNSNAPWRVEDIVINELMFAPISGDDDDEYVELFNRGAAAVDMTGWRFEDGIDYKFPTGFSLPAGGYVVIGRNTGRLIANYPQLNSANTLGNYNGSLKNFGEHISLSKPDDLISTNATGGIVTEKIHIVVAETTYGDGGHWGRYSDGGGSSLELIDPRADALRPSNWADSDESQKSTSATYETSGRLDNGQNDYPPNRLHILMLGDGGEALLDDVEVTTASSANLLSNGNFESGSGTAATGWSFTGNHSLTTVEATGPINGSRSLHIRSQADGDTGINGIRAPLSSGLSSGTTATMRVKARWLAGSPELLLKLRGNWLEFPIRLTVPKNLGTPGLPNSRLVPNQGPAIYEVTHTPALPAANEAVVVSCRVSDPDGIGTVSLRYRVDPASTSTAATMRDDGTGGDAVAGDGIYSTTVTGRGSGTLIGFKIVATDAATTPASATFPQSNMLPVALPSAEGYIRWGDSSPFGNIAHYHLWNTQASDSQRNNALNNTYRDATLVYGNSRIIYNAGFRDKGSPYHGGAGSYAVMNPKDEPLLGVDSRIFRTTGNGGQEETGIRNQVCMWICQQMGLPYLHSHYMRLYRNGQLQQNISQDEEIPNRYFMESWFPSEVEGDLYKIAVWFEFQDNNSSFGAVGATLEAFKTLNNAYKLGRYRWNWQSHGYGGTVNNLSNILDLVTTANDTSANYVPNFQNLADIDQWMNVFAYDRVLCNWDAWTYSVGQNMYAYRLPGSKWKLVPWDIDFTLGLGDGATAGLWGGQDPVMNRFYDTPAFRRALWRAYQATLTTVFDPAKYTPIIEARRNLLVKNGVTGLSGTAPIYSFLTQRRAYIQAQLQGNDSALFNITSNNGGNYTSSTATTKITGRAPFAVANITVNGNSYPATWTDQNTFNITVPLTTRINTLVIAGVDSSGTQVAGATKTITVTYNGAVAQPQDYVVINEINYQPAGDKAAFIELFNSSTAVPFDLSGYQLQGVGYTFPAGSIIQPSSYLVLAGNRIGFSQAYGATIPVFDEFSGRLENNGEYLALVKPDPTPSGTNQIVISDVRYNDKLPWPTNAAGWGPSLQLIDPARGSYRVGNWTATDTNSTRPFTPGTANSVRQNLDAFPPVWLNEVLPSNLVGPVDNAGEKAPFIELYNSSNTTLDLSSYYLTDTYTNLPLWRFPAGTTIGPKQFLLVWADGQPQQSIAGAPHTTFRLNPTNGVVALARLQGANSTPGVIDYLDYKQLTPGLSVGSYPDGEPRERRWLYFVTPGATNNPAIPEINVTINEFMADNTTTIANPVGGGSDDWFELYNAGANAVNLANYTLTDNLGVWDKFTIPPGYVIPAGGYLLVWADDKTKANTNEILHVNFKLSKNGNQLGLFAPNGTPVDTLTFGPQLTDVSQGRFPDGGSDPTITFIAPTPGFANALQGGNHPPVLSVAQSHTVDEMSSLTFTATATDSDAGQKLIFSLDDSAPAGSSINPATGFFSWTPTETQGPGIYSFNIRVIDDGSPPRSASKQVTVIVNELNQPPVLAALSDISVEEGDVVGFVASATDPDLPPQTLTYSLSAGAPSGASIDPLTGIFTWNTPQEAGSTTNTITVQVNDNGPGNLEDTKSFRVITKARFHAVINEIMYQPATTNAAYVEMFNPAATSTQDLSGLRLKGAYLDFTFPTGTKIGPGQFLIVAQNRQVFASAYGAAIPVLGEWTGRLDRFGTGLRLLDSTDKVIQWVNFEAALPWPLGADTGASLQLIDARRDNSRVGNWAAAAATQWQHVVVTGTASSSTLYIYLQTIGDVYLDDIKLVAGTDPDGGPNLLSNGDFESEFPGPYIVGSNHAQSSLSSSIKHSGNFSLHAVATSGGTTRASAIAQDISPGLTQNDPYALSFWYLPNTNGGTLTLRLSGNGINSTLDLQQNAVAGPRFTPGATNNVVASLDEFPPLWINEVLPNNLTGITDQNGEREPWIEIANLGTLPVALDGWSLANDYTNLGQWNFPVGTTIQPQQYLVVVADGQPGQTLSTELHTSFRLSSPAGKLALSRPQLAGMGVVDYLNYSVATADQSFGRPAGQLTGTGQLLGTPTPGAPNQPAPASSPKLAANLTPGGDLTLTWTAQPGTLYRVEIRDSLSAPWKTFTEFVATSTSASVTDTTNQRPERYYRILLP